MHVNDTTRLCSVEGCTEPLRCRGLCNRHYKQAQTRKTIVLRERPVYDTDTCSIEGCGKPRGSGPYCHMHYRRWRIYGDPLQVRRQGVRVYKHPMSFEDTFWSKVRKSDNPDACWPWLGQCNSVNGYGDFVWFYKKQKAHRVAYELTNGPLPPGWQACHHCDNPPCCNPAHLYKGRPKDNTADMIAKGRRGDCRRHLTPSIVLAIRAEHDKGGQTQQQLAVKYGIHHRTLSSVISRHSWKHV